MRSGTREGLELACPFCKTSLARPREYKISSIEKALCGTCDRCGAFYIVDTTGKNLGEVMMQALSITAQKLAKDPTELTPGEDYEDLVLSYDVRAHRSSGEAKAYMDRYGRLYIIKVKEKN